MGSEVAAHGGLTRLSGARAIAALLAASCLLLILAAFSGASGVSGSASFGVSDAQIVSAASSGWPAGYPRDLSGGGEDGKSHSPVIPQPGDLVEPGDDVHDTFGAVSGPGGRIPRPVTETAKPVTTIINVGTGEEFLTRLLRGPPEN